MGDDSCDCHGGDGRRTRDGRQTGAERRCEAPGGDEPRADDASERWIGADEPLDADLPEDLQAALGRFLGADRVATLGDWAVHVRRRIDGDAVTIQELCLREDATEHRGTVDGETHHFACFYDAVILAALEDRPVDVRTASPGGTVVEARAVGTEELDVTPETAVFSFGIDEDAPSAVANGPSAVANGPSAVANGPPAPTDGPTLEASYAAICPYVRAFPDRSEYEQWAATVPAATVALPLEGATELAAALVD